jgi:hypothetical protein
MPPTVNLRPGSKVKGRTGLNPPRPSAVHAGEPGTDLTGIGYPQFVKNVQRLLPAITCRAAVADGVVDIAEAGEVRATGTQQAAVAGTATAGGD